MRRSCERARSTGAPRRSSGCRAKPQDRFWRHSGQRCRHDRCRGRRVTLGWCGCPDGHSRTRCRSGWCPPGSWRRRMPLPNRFVLRHGPALMRSHSQNGVVQARLGDDVPARLLSHFGGARRHGADLRIFDHDDAVALGDPRVLWRRRAQASPACVDLVRWNVEATHPLWWTENERLCHAEGNADRSRARGKGGPGSSTSTPHRIDMNLQSRGGCLGFGQCRAAGDQASALAARPQLCLESWIEGASTKRWKMTVTPKVRGR